MGIFTIHYIVNYYLQVVDMKAEISEETKERVSEILDKPIERNFDRAINQCLDKLEDGNSVDVMVCDQTEKMSEESEQE